MIALINDEHYQRRCGIPRLPLTWQPSPSVSHRGQTKHKHFRYNLQKVRNHERKRISDVQLKIYFFYRFLPNKLTQIFHFSIILFIHIVNLFIQWIVSRFKGIRMTSLSFIRSYSYTDFQTKIDLYILDDSGSFWSMTCYNFFQYSTTLIFPLFLQSSAYSFSTVLVLNQINFS